MRIFLDRFFKFARDFSRFCPFYTDCYRSLTWRDSLLSAKNWTEGEKLLLTIQAIFAHEFTPPKAVNVDLKPSRSPAIIELLTLRADCSLYTLKPARSSCFLPGRTLRRARRPQLRD